MKYIDRIKLSFTGVSSNKFRSFLTLLGIIIGVSVVIILVSLGSGTQAVVGEQYESLSTNFVMVQTEWRLPERQRGTLSLDDKIYLEESILGVDIVLPMFMLNTNVRIDNNERRNRIIGSDENFLDVNGLHIEYGRNLTGSDISNQENVVVIGRRVIDNLVDTNDHSSFLGEEILLDGQKFIIVGIVGVAADTTFISDEIVLTPHSTYANTWRYWSENVDAFYLTYDQQITSEEDIVAQARFLLDDKYGTTRSDESRFFIMGTEEDRELVTNIIDVFTHVLAGIAAISLLVGGIGVMNIMLVTVKERTKEIGVRKAIGASTAEVQKQFLLESIILSISGGMLGIIIGALISTIINFGLSFAFPWWQGSIPAWVILLSFGVTVFIGVVFGFYPAYKASKLDPIDALRYG
ncbi:ABC transporter permease [Natronospora cellulosivora (SeqCode)]